jgi:hypothetical protein
MIVFGNHAFISESDMTPTSKEWVLDADQWIQTYYQLRDGTLYLVENDNKEQTHNESKVDIAAFVRQHATSSEEPYRQMVALLRGLAG